MSMQGLHQTFQMFAVAFAYEILLEMITQAIKNEDWAMLDIIVQAFENVKRAKQVIKANEYLKAKPWEIIIP